MSLEWFVILVYRLLINIENHLRLISQIILFSLLSAVPQNRWYFSHCHNFRINFAQDPTRKRSLWNTKLLKRMQYWLVLFPDSLVRTGHGCWKVQSQLLSDTFRIALKNN